MCAATLPSAGTTSRHFRAEAQMFILGMTSFGERFRRRFFLVQVLQRPIRSSRKSGRSR